MSRDNVAILGDHSGRADALRQAMESSPEVNRVVVAADPREGLDQFKPWERKPFVIISPEKWLVEGLADELRAERYVVFGASKAAAWYEGSKSYATRMMDHEDISQAKVHIPGTLEAARSFVHTHHFEDYVIKYDRLAAGKGAVIPESTAEARTVTGTMWHQGLKNGIDEDIVLFSEKHSGAEVSVMVVVGGGVNDILVLPFSQDHKRLKDGDKGPNTGGMGAYAPVPLDIVSDDLRQEIYKMVRSSLNGMQKSGADIRGMVMYMGIMLSNKIKNKPLGFVKPINLEYNMRFGDPEAQVVIPQLQQAGVDIYRLLRSAGEGRIERPVSLTSPLSHMITVCLASENYPDRSRSGEEVHGLEEDYKNVITYLAAAKKVGKHVLTGGGRELYVTAWGETIDEAVVYAYAAIGEDRICFRGMQYRIDIGHQARSKKTV